MSKSKVKNNSSNLIFGLNKEIYTADEKWYDFYDKGCGLDDIPFDLTWIILFANLKRNKKFKETNEKLKKIVLKNKYLKIYPLPWSLYKTFLVTPADELKVVFIGQDPYFTCEYSNGGKYTPYGVGLSFSIPEGMNKFPSSLENIFANQIKFKHISKMPKTGNLWYWAVQGCLMLNTALTVEDNNKESHMGMWEWFTDYIIEYISNNMSGIIFVMWGGHAYNKIKLINLDKHHTIVSSHPSGLSAYKPLKEHPAFMNKDHFGEINQILRKKGKQQILWE
jgi:uracil-DNA glycosylase